MTTNIKPGQKLFYVPYSKEESPEYTEVTSVDAEWVHTTKGRFKRALILPASIQREDLFMVGSIWLSKQHYQDTIRKQQLRREIREFLSDNSDIRYLDITLQQMEQIKSILNKTEKA